MTSSAEIPATILALTGDVDEQTTRTVTDSIMWEAANHHIYRYGSSAVASSVGDRTAWLSAYLPTPPVELLEGSWVVTKRPEGVCADQPSQHGEPGLLAANLGTVIKKLHQIPLAECPFVEGWQAVADRVQQALHDDVIDSAAMADPYCRYTLAELAEMFFQNRPTSEDMVVGHGHPTTESFYFDNGELTAVTQLSRLGTADRNVDFASLHHSIQSSYGAEAVFGLYESYGPGENLVSIDHYYLAQLLTA